MTDDALLELAKTHVRDAVADLEFPDDDILPVMLFLGPHGPGIMPLPFADDAAKDAYAQAMTATLVVARATEAIFISTAWMSLSISRKPKVMPRDDPDHTEAVILMHCRAGTQTLYTAKVARRVNTAPELGEWEQDGPLPGDTAGPLIAFGGRFSDAIDVAFKFIARMPPKLIDIIEHSWKVGDQMDLVQRFINVAHDVNTGQWPNPN